MILLAVAAILAGALAPAYYRHLMEAREQDTLAELVALADGVRAFYRDTGRVPTQAEGLAALTSDPGVSGWQGPYLVTLDEEPALAATTDAWGQTYVYDAAPTLDTGEAAAALIASGGRDRALTAGSLDGTWTSTAPDDDLLQAVHLDPEDREMDQETAREMEAIAAAAQQYFRENGAYPASLDDLEDAFLDAGLAGDALRDGWRRAYILAPDASAVPPALEIRSRGPDGVDGAGGGDDLARTYTSAAPGRRATLHEIGIAQAVLDANPGLALTGDWSADRAALGLDAFLHEDGWGTAYELRCSDRLVLSAGPDADYLTPDDNIPPGVVPDDCAVIPPPEPTGAIAYVEGSAEGDGEQCDDVEFRIRNTGSERVTITSMTLSWSPDDCWFDEIEFDGDEVFDEEKPKLPNGGTAILDDSFSLRAGESEKMTIKSFRDNSYRGGQRVNMGGAEFTIGFSDGSVITFTVDDCDRRDRDRD